MIFNNRKTPGNEMPGYFYAIGRGRVLMKVNPGDSVKHKDLGVGVCTKVDPKSRFMRYFLKFQDGSVAWFSESRANELKIG